ncbi:carbohydrate ABC transporter permease [Fastidiosipila sanguinis]|uniref:ABC transporter permease n=1 Tax=Fastidiosipila sanguinis TaxID=236753 RepID=A0A2S0KLN1_9FIRM|nr:carbohydrate ABC transporter permease [Fastidiosipila sanguinis]AVM41917.1 ABC transporter permease [Fastidiosipila sanguinis]
MLHKTKGQKVFQVVIVIFFIIMCAIFIIPILNVLAMSLSSTNAILRNDVGIFPVDLTTIGYKQVFSNDKILSGFKNSFLVIGVHTPLALIGTAFAAYPLAYGDFKGKKLYNYMIVLTMWIAGGLIPSFMVVNYLGMVDTLWSIIIPSLLGAYNIIILRNYFESIPTSLIESAKIDGAHDFTILFRIILPLSKPVLATITLWIVVARWNEFFAPLMYLRDSKKYTLQVILRDIIMSSEMNEFNMTAAEGTLSIPEQLRNASIIISLVPMLVVYPFLQKYFVTGIMLGSVKG